MNPLTNAIPPQYRRYLYALLFVAGVVFSVYQASDGDWAAFVGGLIVSLGGATAHSNTPRR